VYGAAPAPLPRVVPAGGTNIAGFAVPAGTTVATQSWSVHRVESVFPDPSKFNPDRWIEATADEEAAMAVRRLSIHDVFSNVIRYG